MIGVVTFDSDIVSELPFEILDIGICKTGKGTAAAATYAGTGAWAAATTADRKERCITDKWQERLSDSCRDIAEAGAETPHFAGRAFNTRQSCELHALLARNQL